MPKYRITEGWIFASALIKYDLPKDGHVKLSIWNLMGAEVRLLVNHHTRAGRYRCKWNGRDNSGRVLPTGIYLVRFEAGAFSATLKIVMLK